MTITRLKCRDNHSTNRFVELLPLIGTFHALYLSAKSKPRHHNTIIQSYQRNTGNRFDIRSCLWPSILSITTRSRLRYNMIEITEGVIFTLC